MLGFRDSISGTRIVSTFIRCILGFQGPFIGTIFATGCMETGRLSTRKSSRPRTERTSMRKTSTTVRSSTSIANLSSSEGGNMSKIVGY
jgi:hypothetical protein